MPALQFGSQARPGQQGNPYYNNGQQPPPPQGQQPLQQGGVQYGTPGQPAVNNDASLATPIGDSNNSGATYESARNNQAVQALQNNMSGQSVPDAAANSAVQSALMQRLGTLNNNADTQKNELDTQLQRGQNESLNSLRRDAGGTGSLGNTGYNQAVGNIASGIAGQRAQGLQGINEQSLKDLEGVQSSLGNINSQDLNQNEFNYAQGSGLANLLQGQSAQDLARTQGLTNSNQAATNSTNQLIGGLAGGLGGGIGSLLGQPTNKTTNAAGVTTGGGSILASLFGM